jgi:hypothetical protein
MSYFKRTTKNIGLVFAATASLLAASGCSTPFKVTEVPTGFVEVSESDWGARYKALDNVGMRVHAFENHKGGTLDYWGADLVNKLATRGYTKTGEGKTKSGNGVEGRVFHFDYSPPGQKDEAGEDLLKFYTAVLFVTEKHRVVLEYAGDAAYAQDYRPSVDEVAKTISIR